MKAATKAASEILLAELRQETQTALKARRTMVHAAWVMTFVCIVALAGIGGIALAALH